MYFYTGTDRRAIIFSSLGGITWFEKIFAQRLLADSAATEELFCRQIGGDKVTVDEFRAMYARHRARGAILLQELIEENKASLLAMYREIREAKEQSEED